MFESEVFHCREHLPKGVQNLGCTRDLRVVIPAVDSNGKGIRMGLTSICLHTSLLVREPDLSAVEPEALCRFYKLDETWEGIGELSEDQYLQPFKERGYDSTNNRFQVSAKALEPE